MTPHDFTPIAGEPYELEDRLRLILAPNPSPMTYLGTNTYLLGHRQIAVIDPGPESDAHLAAILAAVGDASVSHIIVTHSHVDHSPLAKRLSQATGAKIHAFGTHLEGRSPIMAKLAASGLAGGGEGIDAAFSLDVHLADGDRVETDEWCLTAVHTPGHIGNHLSLIWNNAVFTGDHVMGWASSLVSPPDGDLTDFMRSCEKLKGINARIYYAGHGAPITQPRARLDWLIAHRLDREAQILKALVLRAKSPMDLTLKIYTDIPQTLMPAALRNVFAHLVDLHQRGQIQADPDLSIDAIFNLLQEK